MKNLTHAALIALTLFAGTSHAAESSQPEALECISNAPAHVAEGTVVDHDGDASAEAERRAAETAAETCAASDAGVPVFVEITTRDSGAVATCTLRFVCSERC
jgi:hypothetical protein